MIKQYKFAIMAFFLIVGSKLIQTLFIDQAPKKKFYPKVELVDESKKKESGNAENTAKRSRSMSASVPSSVPMTAQFTNQFGS